MLFRSTAVASGEEALRAARAQRPDAIVLDIGLPGISGLEVCRRLRAQDETRSIPLLLVSALDDMATRLEGREVGADDFAAKPFVIRELLSRVEQLISRSAPELNPSRLHSERVYHRRAQPGQ